VTIVTHPADQEQEARYREYVWLLAQHERQLAGYVHALVPRWHDAEDVLQDTKLRLWEQFDTFQPGSNFAAWSCTVAGFMVQTYRKHCQRERVCFSDDLMQRLARYVPMVSATEPDEDLSALIECVKALSKASRNLLRLVCLGQRKIKDVAAELGQTPAATRVALFRIRQALAKCVKKRLKKEEHAEKEGRE
jgi:RNA polymerase sigma-70 factor (ECF subfamily)